MPHSANITKAIFTWSTVMKLAFTTGLFTAVFTESVAWVKEAVQYRGKKRREGQQLALKLVDQLTAYAQECNSLIDRNEYEGEECYYSIMPDLSVYPDDEGWAVLPGRIAAALQDFRNEVTQATRNIEATSQIIGPLEANDVAQRHFINVGYQALRISKRLRKKYKFGSYQSATDYQFTDELRRRYRKNRRNRLNRIWNSFPVHKFRRNIRKRWLALTTLLVKNILNRSP